MSMKIIEKENKMSDETKEVLFVEPIITEDKITKLANKIRYWEYEAGESFKDYFLHDNLNWINWAFWLIGKGYVERGRAIIAASEAGDTCICQSLLFDVTTSNITGYNTPYKNTYEGHELGDWDEDTYFKDILIWSEFLMSCTTYQKRLEEFFQDYEIYFEDYKE